LIQVQLKLKLKREQETMINEWFPILTSIWNWAIKKIEKDAADHIYYNKFEFINILAGHNKRLGMPSHTIQAMLKDAHTTWQRCFKKLARAPRLKGQRNRLTSISFPDPIKEAHINRTYVELPYLGKLKYHKQRIPIGKVKCARLVKRASGFYLCLFIDAQSNRIAHKGCELIGIQLSVDGRMALSNGDIIQREAQLQKHLNRLAQAQRGGNKKLVARLHERIANCRKDANHKLSRKIVEQYDTIVVNKDDLKQRARNLGLLVADSANYQLRLMMCYKSENNERKYIEFASKTGTDNAMISTVTCSVCRSPSGPASLTCLKVREWVCVSCGTLHDRDVNTAKNTLIAGLGASHESDASRVRNLLTSHYEL